jgi:hypothetical protein
MHLIKYYYVYHVKEDKNDGARTFYGIYEKNMYNFWEKPERYKPFGRCRRTWEDNIKIDLKNYGC